MQKRILAILAAALILAGVLASVPATAVPTFENLVGFATKTGFRGVFAWQASEPVLATVHYGVNPAGLDKAIAAIPGGPDRAGMAIAEDLEVGKTYYWQVEDSITGNLSEIRSFKAANAYTDWNGGTYTLDLLVQLDSESLPPDVPFDLALENMAAGMNVFSERLYDATDGYARLGNILITDTNLDYGANIPAAPIVCLRGDTNAADVLVQTTVPFDSHTFGGWAIGNPCISFYVGRLGQLIIPWGAESDEDLHFGYVSTHEMMHYAFNAPDLYDPNDINNPRRAGCWNLQWDGSVMHNSGGWAGGRWELTELDRNPATTPCDHQHDGSWTWDMLRTRYTNFPAADPDGPVGSGIGHIVDSLPRGNEDGGALNIQILDREPGVSSLTHYTPDDRLPPSAGMSTRGGADAASWTSGRMDLFSVGGAGDLAHRWYGGSWSPWESLGGGLTSDPGSVSWGRNRLDAFARGTDGALWHIYWDQNAWGPWEKLGGSLSSGPDVSSWQSNRLDVFARGTDNALWHISWNGAHWSPWDSLGGTLTSAPGTVSWGPNRVDVFARGTDGNLWQRAWTGTSWTPWGSIGP